MGNYLFSTRTLSTHCTKMPRTPQALTISAATFRLPELVADRQAIFAYDYQTNKIPGEPPDSIPYWRDVGTIEAYWEANMDMRAVNPALNFCQSPVASAHHQLSRSPRQIHLRR